MLVIMWINHRCSYLIKLNIMSVSMIPRKGHQDPLRMISFFYLNLVTPAKRQSDMITLQRQTSRNPGIDRISIGWTFVYRFLFSELRFLADQKFFKYGTQAYSPSRSRWIYKYKSEYINLIWIYKFDSTCYALSKINIVHNIENPSA